MQNTSGHTGTFQTKVNFFNSTQLQSSYLEFQTWIPKVLLTGQHFFSQKDWFAKKRVSLRGSRFMFTMEKKAVKLFSEFHDLYSESGDKQNWYFSASYLGRSNKKIVNSHHHCSHLILISIQHSIQDKTCALWKFQHCGGVSTKLLQKSLEAINE